MGWDERMYLSASQLSSFTYCGLKYKLLKIDKLPDPPSAALIKGQVVHDTLEHWELSGRELDFETHYRQSWLAQLSEQLEKYPDLEVWGHDRRSKSAESDLKYKERDGLNEVKIYTERALAEAHLWEIPKLPDGHLAVEIPFKLEFPDFVISGRIDALQRWFHDGSFTVADYKTGSASGESYQQLGTYRVGLGEAYGIDVSFGRLIYTKPTRDNPYGKTSDWIDLRSYTKTYIESQYRLLKLAREHEIYIPSPSKEKCSSCPVRKHCPEYKGTN